MQDHELDAWLGPVEATEEQREQLLTASDMLDARYPDPDMQESMNEAFNAAAEIILDGVILEDVAREWHRARAIERTEMDRLTGAITAAAIQGTPETKISEIGRVNRQTVRKALGK